MEKKKIKIIDTLFAHAKYSTDFQDSKYIEWDRNITNSDICFYTDATLNYITLAKNLFNKNIAWLVESPEITKMSYDWIKNNYFLFDEIFTHNKKLLELDNKFSFIPCGGCWIKSEDHKIYEKTKIVSIISSGKNDTEGHKLRHKIVQKMENLDVYGRAYKEIDYKLTALKDYMFSVTIENCREDYYFTEKLIDCFQTGTVPIYWGCPSIGNFFNTKGMILIENIEDIDNIVLTEEKFHNMKEYIKENFELSKQYLISEDIIYKKLIK
jgi:hypothetical protein